MLYNLNPIYISLYDLFDQNYLIHNGKQYTRIHHINYLDRLIQVNNEFRIIILVDKNKLDKIELSFLSMFEKIFLDFSKINNYSIKQLADSINVELDMEKMVNKLNYKIYYNLKDLLISCHQEDILLMIYYELHLYKNIKEKDIK